MKKQNPNGWKYQMQKKNSNLNDDFDGNLLHKNNTNTINKANEIDTNDDELRLLEEIKNEENRGN